ncbi:hypothetical protein GCM10022247_26150 [Allokutzneria multivorans]|uniref:DUF3592 domain-containing protein n=2 Tax=Allokutzneria multivorans TaxID=1142134 RepID=A0ABP7RY86_9PSEU
MLLVMIGLAVVGGAWWASRVSAARHSQRFQVVVKSSDNYVDDRVLVPLIPRPGGVLALRLTEEREMAAVTVGDVLWVYPDPDMPSRVRLDRSVLTRFWTALMATGAVLAATGVVVLLRGDVGMPVHTANGAVAGAFFFSGLVCTGTVALVGLAELVLNWKSSRRVNGTVVAVEEYFAYRKNGYQPLVEYVDEDGTVRRVWGMKRGFRPRLGRRIAVRVAGRPPHEAMHTTPLFLVMLLVLLLFGLLGWSGLAVMFGVVR